ncbi:heterokaryon incompatibility protein-domain-containing protein [Podospora aff. communis PSN243]|uniref:Heterokaryon incompatibility protein-domain-containing protein n=1 Tax=Podospora aff. communis PSN243 TaxID=3040156 RepID=A0AAV9GL37_9PEZI|nr:heterokaryon incompatibility protein-domain-containing protein [Podospora aff. communis PSN243]
MHSKQTCDARNEALFSSRLARLDQTITPWLKNVAGEERSKAIGGLDISATTEVKEECLLRNVEAILAIALPDDSKTSIPRNSDGSTAGHQLGSTPTPTSNGSLYANLQLDKDTEQIRVLELLPSPSPDSEIAMALFTVPSPRSQGYSALSYTWGTPEPKHTTTVNGQPFSVGTNLFNALRSLRLPDRPRLLWIDAICINQQDDAERAFQVALMGSIYAEAESVSIFIGMPSPKSYPLFDFLERDRRLDDITQENVEEILAECHMDKMAVISSFVEFCDREWWTRVWVMQEYYLSVRAPDWYIGSRSVSGGKLARDVKGLAMASVRLAMPFSDAGSDLGKELGRHTTSSLVDRLLKTCDGVLVRKQTNPHDTPRFLFAKHGRKATSAMDYVYGVRELLEPHFRKVFVPDYGLKLCELYEKLAAWFLLMDGWGDMLWYYPFRVNCERQGDGSSCKVPSWAPNFSRRPEHLVNEAEPPKFLSDGPNTVQCAIVDKVLYLEGCRLGLIREVIVMPEGDCFEVLQRMWQLDRIHCSNQRSGSNLDTPREERALLAWATTIQPPTVPFAPRWRETGELLAPDLQRYVQEIGVRSNALLDEKHATAKASPETPEIQAWYKHESTIIATAHGRQTRGAGNLHRYLTMEMECDFASACAFDFDNLDFQLRIMDESPDIKTGLNVISSPTFPREVVYVDLIRTIESNSDQESPTSFKELVAIVRGIARKIYEKVVQEGPDQGPRQPLDVARMRELLDGQKEHIKKLQEGDKIALLSFGTEAEREEQVRSLQKQVEEMERLLQWRDSNEMRADQIHGAEDKTWSRVDEERAAQFRGRRLFVTKEGLVGIASPGVRDVRVGDQVVLMDGMTFPLIAREAGGERLAVVGCANVRGVKLGQKVEEAELKGGVKLVPKAMMAFV